MSTDRQDAPPPRGSGLTEWRLTRSERRLDTIEDEFPKTYATKEQHDDLRKIVYAIIGLAATTISIIFASSFHLFIGK